MKFSWSDLRSIQKQILSRLRRDGDTNALAVGVGVKNAHRRPRKREAAVVIVVREKIPRHRLSKKVCLGRKRRVRVRVGRGKGSRFLTLPTDIITLRPAIPTAAQTRSGDSQGSAGALIFWREASAAASWGLLTAGHVLSGADSNVFVTPTSPGGGLLGAKSFHTKPGAPFDVGVIRIEEAAAAQLLAPGVSLTDPPSMRLRDFAALQADVDEDRDRGQCLAAGRTVSFDTELALAGPFESIQGLPRLQNILRVRAAPDGAGGPFRPGTSGSPWLEVAPGLPMGFLVGAEPPGFVVGYGHSIVEVLAYIKKELGVSDLRLVLLF